MISPGIYPASVTPFDEKGRLDIPGLARIIHWFKSAGCAGIVFAGTNGEGPSLSATEKRDLIRDAVPLAQGLPVILGIATASIEEAVWLCRQGHTLGAAAALVMPPAYFTEAGEEGLAQWFEILLERSPLDVLVYNFPQRTGLSLSAELMHRLAKHDRMIGLKDSSGHPENVQAYADALAGTERRMYTGDETLLVQGLRAGWAGAISGAANPLPDWLSQVVAEWPTDPESAETKFELILPAIRALRSTPQPYANKELLYRLGVMARPDLRLPLMPQPGPSVEEAWAQVRALVPPHA